jgi:uncharacterized surface protein with fasciclin (FAS1) repeats
VSDNEATAAMHEFRRRTDADIGALRQELSSHMIDEAARDSVMLEKLNTLEQKVDELAKVVAGLVKMVNQASGVTIFIKWAAAIVAAAGATWAWIATQFNVTPK